MGKRSAVLVSLLLLVGSVSLSTGQTLLFSVHGGGREGGVHFGGTMTGIGDVNGDNVPDLAVGYQDLNRVVLFSGAMGTRLRTLRAPTPQAFAHFGEVLANLGDVNGDGVPDLAVGAPGHDVEETCCSHGQVEVFSGADGTPLRTLRAPTPQGWAHFGRALANLGDVNEDGVPDLAVGAPGHDVEEEEDHGQVEVFSGADGTPLRTLRAPTPQAFADFGAALANLGDVNEDGVPDLAVGAPGQDGKETWRSGQVEVFSGTDGTHLRTLRAPAPQARAFFGEALANLGDVNGDGVPDLAVGAPGQEVEEISLSGQVEVFSGADGTHLRTLRAPAPQDGAEFGAALAIIGDVNGDGVPDLAAGAPGHDVKTCCDHGQVVLFSGATGTRLRTLRGPAPQAEAHFGAALANMGDVNGDGVPDLAVSAPDQDIRDVTDRGQAVVFSVATTP